MEILQAGITQVTLNRDLAKLVKDGLIDKSGKGRGIRYRVSAKYHLFAPIDREAYFNKEIDYSEEIEFMNGHEVSDEEIEKFLMKSVV